MSNTVFPTWYDFLPSAPLHFFPFYLYFFIDDNHTNTVFSVYNPAKG